MLMPLYDEPSEHDLLLAFDDDPDPERAGQGLVCFPLIRQAIGLNGYMRYWMMSPAEQVAMIFLLEQLTPDVSIEIGTRFGGSLQVISRFSKKVYAIDIDPDVPKRLAGRFSNVEYLIGSSVEILPCLLERLEHERANLSFVLVDGDHSALGVQGDIDCILKFRPIAPLYIVMHDSFNPECRAGLRSAQWSSNAYVHAVELDFVSGAVNPSPAFRDQLWGGLALGIFLPHRRTDRFEITAKSERTFQTAMRSNLPQKSFVRRALRRARRALVN
jgi:hypothetical protein